MRVDNLDSGLAEMRAMLKEMRALARATPLSNASVGRGRIRMYDNSVLLIEDGNLSVTGTATVTGTLQVAGELNGDGTITWSGPVNLNGLTKVTGDMSVEGGGKIKVGSMTIDPSISGGAIAFANGSQVFTDGSTIQVYLGNGVVQVSNAEAKIQLGGVMVRLTAAGIQMGGLPTRTRANAQNAVIGTVWSDTNGNLYRVVN